MNFWYGVEEDVYLKASALGSALEMMEIFVGVAGAQFTGINESSFCWYVGELDRRFGW